MKLYGIGIGPGDPGLITLRAKQLIDKVGVIFIPNSSRDSGSSARSIVERVITGPKRLIELIFPMTKDRAVLRQHWVRAAKKIVKELSAEKEGAFITLGDPFIYSTYIYLLDELQEKFPEVEVETIPGISAFSAAASRCQIPLVKGDEKLAVLPVRDDLKGLREALKEFDTVVLMKIGSKLEKVLRLLKDMGLLKNSVLVSRLGQQNEKIVYDLSSVKDKREGYLSLMIVRKQ